MAHTPQELMQIGSKLVDFCNANKEAEALNTLYAPDARSVEAVAMPGGDGAAVEGLDAIRAKHDWWYGAHEVHSTSAEGPFVHGDDRFNVIFEMDVTNKESGERIQMREVATYTVENGKITREEFAYAVA